MIAMRPMLSTIRIVPAVILALLLAACTTHLASPGPSVQAPAMTDGFFTMADGARLPYRRWMPPAGTPLRAVVLALHGMNDSRDAWEYPAPDFAAAGIAVYAPDQRGFGAAPGRGYWPGSQALVDDARQMAALMAARYPHLPLILMGESMGGAVLMKLATEPDAPAHVRYVLVAPAVWGRQDMNWAIRAALWVTYRLLPGLRLSGAGAHRVASDNREALIRLSEDPLTLLETRVDAIHGLVDLMGSAQRAAAHFRAPALFLYGGHDELVPKRAMAATWRALPAGARLAFYPHGYHLLLRDLDRKVPIDDIIAWIEDPAAPLPSGAGETAREWLAERALIHR
ncbi:MAG: lysophospholipase [Rhodospirillales bacterium]|nr:lysophospholipase [Rhodospirillales bacterium]